VRCVLRVDILPGTAGASAAHQFPSQYRWKEGPSVQVDYHLYLIGSPRVCQNHQLQQREVSCILSSGSERFAVVLSLGIRPCRFYPVRGVFATNISTCLSC
ncbi:unnamed protein product, partial [Laminaria digitata]